MSINHARATVALFVSASGSEEINAPNFASHDAVSVDTYTAPTGAETGATANRATLVYSDAKSFSSTEVYTLTLSSSLSGPFGGSTFGFATIKGLWIKNTGSTVITVGGDCTLISGGTIYPGQTLCVSSPTTGHTVTLSTTDSLTLTNATGSGSAEILILGS